jgi:RNA polymerase sigma factor FliA
MNPYEIETSEPADKKRERLILEQLPQVHLIARRLHDRLPESVCFDDLVSSGVLGLIAAIDNFDQAYGVKLKTYAEHKIRGAILDSLRGIDWASRHRRKKSKNIEAAVASLQQRLQRAPSEDEIAAELGLTLDQYHARLSEIHGLNLESLDVAVGPSGNQTMLSLIPDDEENLPSGLLERSELERLLAEGINGLPKIEKTILSLYYKEELTLREIGEILDMHISRVSELKTQAILRLRVQMRRQWPCDRGR